MCAAKVMPVDLAMHMSSRHDSVDQLLGTSTLRSHRGMSRPSIYDTLRSRAVRSPEIPSSPVNSISPPGTPKKKKQVVFADDKGLALTVVRIFRTDPAESDDEEIPSPVRSNAELYEQSKKLRFRLGFTQPSADAPSFFEKLSKSLVHLESCSLIYGSLFGKVRVCNISPEKAVHVRITFDSWRSHQDIPCTLVPQNNGDTATEVFVFNIPVPSNLTAQDRVEFCLSFRPGSGNIVFWDRNCGQNYQILIEDENSEEVSSVEKKPLMSQNSQTTQSLPLRTGPGLYRSASLSSLFSSKNIKILIRQENIVPKGYSPPHAINAGR